MKYLVDIYYYFSCEFNLKILPVYHILFLLIFTIYLVLFCFVLFILSIQFSEITTIVIITGVGDSNLCGYDRNTLQHMYCGLTVVIPGTNTTLRKTA